MQRALAGFACLLACTFSVNPTYAAAIHSTPLTSDKGQVFSIIEIDGDLELGDEMRFADVAIAAGSSAIVSLNSPGGATFAGIEIGRAIRLKGFPTVVAKDAVCASACALIWLGGTPRLMAPGARIGFHATYNKDDLQPSSAGNAAVGAYLNQLGLTTNAILYITAAAPADMQWLSFEDAEKVGIEVKPFETAEADPTEGESERRGNPAGAGPSAGPAPDREWIQLASRASLSEAIRVAMNVQATGQSPTVFRYDNGWFVVVIGPYPAGTAGPLRESLLRTASIPYDSLVTLGAHYVEAVWGNSSAVPAPAKGTAEALAAAQAFFASSSADGGEALHYLARLYPNRLMYFGRLTDKSAVLEDKANFFARWPERSYSIEPGSLMVSCRPDGSCQVSGLVNWRVHSRPRKRSSTGTARFELVFTGPGASQLVAESSAIINRRRFPDR